MGHHAAIEVVSEIRFLHCFLTDFLERTTRLFVGFLADFLERTTRRLLTTFLAGFLERTTRRLFAGFLADFLDILLRYNRRLLAHLRTRSGCGSKCARDKAFLARPIVSTGKEHGREPQNKRLGTSGYRQDEEREDMMIFYSTWWRGTRSQSKLQMYR